MFVIVFVSATVNLFVIVIVFVSATVIVSASIVSTVLSWNQRTTVVQRLPAFVGGQQLFILVTDNRPLLYLCLCI